MSLYYRVGTEFSGQGLWYTPAGEFTGHIHSQFDWLKVSVLQMPYDEQLRGWLSITPSLEELFHWFSREEILRLQPLGYFIFVYEAEHVKFYAPHQHWVIQQDSARLVGKLTLF